MAFRKSRRLRRNLRKSRKNRNRSRHYRGGGPKEDAQLLVNTNSERLDDPNFGQLAVPMIKARYPDNMDLQDTMTRNVILMIPTTNPKARNFLQNHAESLTRHL
jgi:hypothetical protein